MVEITPPDAPNGGYVQDDIEPFVSPRDGTIIKSRSQLRDYMGQHNLVHYDPSNKAEADRYAAARDDQARRELIWEGVDRLFHTGRVEFKGPRYNEDDSI